MQINLALDDIFVAEMSNLRIDRTLTLPLFPGDYLANLPFSRFGSKSHLFGACVLNACAHSPTEITWCKR